VLLIPPFPPGTNDVHVLLIYNHWDSLGQLSVLETVTYGSPSADPHCSCFVSVPAGSPGELEPLRP